MAQRMFGLAQMRQFDDGHFGESELACCGDTAVSGHDAIVAIDQNRVDKIELPDRRRDLFDLLFRVCTGVPRVGFKILHLAVGDLEPECSRDNILERTARFAAAFLRNEDNLEAMVQPVRTGKALPKPPPRMRRQEDDLYSALGGSGEPVYLSDGVWLTPGGGAHDWGR